MKQIIMALAIITLFTGDLLGGEKVDMQKFIHETQRLEQGPNSFQLIWWIPTEFWKQSFRNTPSLTVEQKEGFYQAVDDYIVVCVIDAKTTAFGSIVPSSRNEILDKLSLTIGEGKMMKSLPNSEVSDDALNLFAMMKPMMSKMLGQFGKGMEFICFRGLNAEGEKLLDPKGKNSFVINMEKTEYKWRLPLGSLLPPKYDSRSGEKFPGNYIFNPFTGNKLVLKTLDNSSDKKQPAPSNK